MTSAPSVTDIGLSGMRRQNRMSADQPVASTIGTSGTSARRSRRKASSRTSATAARPATSAEHAPPRRRDAVVGLGREHRQAGELRLTPAGGWSCRRIAEMTCSWRSSGMSRMPNASVAVRRSRVMTPCEKYGGTASSSAAICGCDDAPPLRKRSGSENAGHSSALPQPRFSL